MIEVEDGDDDTIFTAAYDARTRRIAKTENDKTMRYRYDGGTSFQDVGTNQYNNEYYVELIRAGGLGGGIGSVLYSYNEDETGLYQHFVYDALGNTISLTDDSANVTQSTMYDAFGQTVEQTGTSTRLRDIPSGIREP